MAQYRVTEPSYIKGRYVPAGEIIDYDGVPGFNLDPVDDAAKQAKAEAGKAGGRDVNGREFQEDLTRSDGTPSAVEEKPEPEAEPKLDPAPGDDAAKQAKAAAPTKGK